MAGIARYMRTILVVANCKTISNRAHPNRTPIPEFRSRTGKESRTHTVPSPTAHAKNPHRRGEPSLSFPDGLPRRPSPAAPDPGSGFPRRGEPHGSAQRFSRRAASLLGTPPRPRPSPAGLPRRWSPSPAASTGAAAFPPRGDLCSACLLPSRPRASSSPTPPDLLRPSTTSPRWPSLAQAHGGVPEDYPARSRRRPEDDGTRGPDGDRSTGSWIWPARPPARSVGGSSARPRRPRSSVVSPRRAGRASPWAHHFGRQRRAGPAVRPVWEQATSALRRRARIAYRGERACIFAYRFRRFAKSVIRLGQPLEPAFGRQSNCA
ncbi:uncharacterized protein [Miscanthus floridulus]|uniref:uncharacterized protein n=1 Tax=Miscanthus floridulus TaxID=154761 RepID=UPI0034577844